MGIVDRTAELRKMGYTGRNLRKLQMTTDTAVRVTRMVVEGKRKPAHRPPRIPSRKLTSPPTCRETLRNQILRLPHAADQPARVDRDAVPVCGRCDRPAHHARRHAEAHQGGRGQESGRSVLGRWRVRYNADAGFSRGEMQASVLAFHLMCSRDFWVRGRAGWNKWVLSDNGKVLVLVVGYEDE